MREGSYHDIRPGMPVTGPGGEEDGAVVTEVLYDEASDIFVGLVIDAGTLLMRSRLYVPGERLVAVHDGQVSIDAPFVELHAYVSPEEKRAGRNG